MEYTQLEAKQKNNFIEELLKNRGVDDIENYLNPSEKLLNNPFDLCNMDSGLELLHRHLMAGSKIFILPDADQDGYTSAAIMWKYIKSLFPDANLYYKIHSGKQHGIILDYIEPDTKLIVLPDASSSQYEEHKIIKEKGIDILVLDHHEAKSCSEDACVINNQLSPDYTNKNLSGAGIAYKFCQAYNEKYELPKNEDNIDLAAVGIIGDVMNLNDLENRYIVWKGLMNIENFGIKAFIKKQAYSIRDTDHVTPENISWYITPLVNAIIRVGDQEEKQLLFESFIADKDEYLPSSKRGHKEGDTELLSDQIARLATNARSKQNRSCEKAIEGIRGRIVSEKLNEHKILIVPIDDVTIDKSLTGLIAMQLVTLYKKPVLIVREDKGGYYNGSGRNNDRSDLKDLKKLLLSTDCFDFVEGHANAHGVRFAKSNLEAILLKLDKELENVDFNEASYLVDWIFDGDKEKDSLLEYISEIGGKSSIWGKGVEEPLIAIENIIITKDEIKKIGANLETLKFSYNGVSYIQFKAKKMIEEIEKYDYIKLSIVGTANINNWGGRTELQVFIKDMNVENNMLDF